MRQYSQAMIEDNVTAVIRYFVNETMRFENDGNGGDGDEKIHVYGRTINLSVDVTSTTSTATVVHVNRTPPNSSSSRDSSFQNAVIIPLYAVIFGCCVVGNLFVILTLAQNKRMRTVTNVYLLNLAISDLLLGVFCMPFTLVGQILRNFIFGPIMCKLIPYFQAASVSVAVWTLVAISLERYFAICRPLSSRRWQTRSHAYKMIATVWIISMVCNSPLMIVQQLQPMSKVSGAMKCREVWPSESSERTYVIFLDVALLLVPLISMGLAYSLIVSKLWRGLKREMKHSSCQRFYLTDTTTNNENGLLMTAVENPVVAQTQIPLKHHRNLVPKTNGFREKLLKKSLSNGKFHCTAKFENGKAGDASIKMWLFNGLNQTKPAEKPLRSALKSSSTSLNQSQANNKVRMAEAEHEVDRTALNGSQNERLDTTVNSAPGGGYQFNRQAIRSNYMDKSIEAKKKVIRMLFVIIIEFFVCWAPLHILNTVYLFSPAFVYSYVNNTGIALIQLMAYISSCCNPITYCFMNRRFRAAFSAIVRSYKCCSCLNTQSTETESQMYSLKHRNIVQVPCNSDASNNSNSGIYGGRANATQRSELMVLDTEERV